MELRGWEGLSCHKGHRARTASALLPPPTAPSGARRPRAATSGVRRAHDDPRVITPARRLLLQQRVGGCWRPLVARLEAPHRAANRPIRPPMRRVGRPARRAQVRCAAEWRPLLWASRDAGGPPPPRWRRRHPFPRPTFSPPRQRGCTCPRARSRLWSRPACSVSMRRRARHRPEGQGIARTCLEILERPHQGIQTPKRLKLARFCQTGNGGWDAIQIGFRGDNYGWNNARETFTVSVHTMDRQTIIMQHVHHVLVVAIHLLMQRWSQVLYMKVGAERGGAGASGVGVVRVWRAGWPGRGGE